MPNNAIKLQHCRICGNQNLVTVLDLGEQVLTGVFPKAKNQMVEKGPLQLVKCHGSDEGAHCGLVQLGHSYSLSDMYGENYGYRSGLNASMVSHLQQKVEKIVGIAKPVPGDLIIDIGSNDGTTLGAYPKLGFRLLGVDPTGEKFRQYYPEGIDLIPDFFSAVSVKAFVGSATARVITSFSMFYDLELPLQFAQEVRSLLDRNGIWVFEQSYMPGMLKQNSYDTVCHEHLEYYGMHQIKWIIDRADLKIVDVEFNDVNGGSFSVVAAPVASDFPDYSGLAAILAHERELSLDKLQPYISFAGRVEKLKESLLEFVAESKKQGKKIAGLGASTKGNVILQYCDFSESDIDFVGEVNSDKFNCLTPGTLLPIVTEDFALSQPIDYFIVLPWHFKKFFMSNPRFKGRSLVFPLPDIAVCCPE
jgi:hypothetical protein